MRTPFSRCASGGLVLLSTLALACSGTSSPGGTGGTNAASTGGDATGGAPTTTTTGGALPSATGGAATGGKTVQDTGGSPGAGGQARTGGQATTGGAQAMGGDPAVGGQTTTGGQAGQGTGGDQPTGGRNATGGNAATGGTPDVDAGIPTGGSGGGTPPDASQKTGCVPTKTWGTADPASPGPFQVVTETNIGPAAGTPDARWNNTIPHFNLYRPKDLSQGYCHPIITWANGTGDQPPTYEVLIKQLVSHGFVVVASLSSMTLSGKPLPQVAGVDWMLEENENPASALYHHLDIDHIGATGHSQGGAATVAAAVADPRITAIAPIAGAYPLGAPVPASTKINGPAALLCGGKDDIIPCSLVEPAFKNLNDFPVLFGNNLGDNHGSWIGSIKNPYMVAVTGWMRVHLMGDTANRAMFYGSNCTLCTDTQHWTIQRKMMDQ